MPIFNPMLPHDCVLKSGRIDIWQIQLQHEPPLASSYLNEQERERAQRFHFAHHRRRFTVARAAVRIILGRYLACDPRQIDFAYNAHGKPGIDGSDIQFNLSHSQELALFAVGIGYPIGIDIEFFSARPYEGIGGQIFSSVENEHLQNAPTFLKPLTFFHLWAQKEALIKACGLGLSYPTKQFDLPGLPPANQVITDPLYKNTWRVQSFMPTIESCAALCSSPDIEDIRFLRVNDLESLLK